jgi:hypothetical protein
MHSKKETPEDFFGEQCCTNRFVEADIEYTPEIKPRITMTMENTAVDG